MKKIVFSGVSFVFVAFTQLATASVVLLEDNRSAQSLINYVYGGQNSNITYSPTTPFSDWTATTNLPELPQYTLQSSTVSNDFMSGSGMGMQGYDSDMISGYGYQYSSYFSIHFRVDAAQNMQLDTTLKAFTNECCDLTALALRGSQGTLIGALVQGVPSTAAGDPTVTDYSGNGLLNLSKLIMLSPGEYTLSIGTNFPYVDGKPSTGGNWTFTASFSNAPAAVPLPSSMWFFASALGAMTRRFLLRRG